MSEDSKLQVNSEKLVSLKKDVDNAFSVAELLPGGNKKFEISESVRKEFSNVIATTIFDTTTSLGITDIDIDFGLDDLSDVGLESSAMYSYKVENGIEFRKVILDQDYVAALGNMVSKSRFLKEVAENHLRQTVAHEYFHARQQIKYPQSYFRSHQVKNDLEKLRSDNGERAA